jgi:hypothetical protein
MSYDLFNNGFSRIMAHAKAAKVTNRAISFAEAIAAARDKDDVKTLDMLSKIRAMASRTPFSVPSDKTIDPVTLQRELVAAGMDVEDRLSLKTMLLRARLLEP